MGVPAALANKLQTTGLSVSGFETAWATEASDIKDAGSGLSLVQFLPWGEFTAHAQGFRVAPESVPAIAQVTAAVGESLIDYEHNSVDNWMGGIEFSSRAAGWLKAIIATETGTPPETDTRFAAIDAPGVWGAVQFTDQAKAMIKAGEYRYFSPVFLHDGDGLVLGVVGGGLTNVPAIRGMRQLAAKDKERDMGNEPKIDWSKIAAESGLENPGAIGTAAEFQAALAKRQTDAVAAAETAANARAEAAESQARSVKATQLIAAGLKSGALPAGTGDFWTEQAKTAAGMATLEGALAAAKPAAPAPDKPAPPAPGIESKSPGGVDAPAAPSIIMSNEPPPGVQTRSDGLQQAEAALAHAKALKGTPGHKAAVLAAYARQQGV